MLLAPATRGRRCRRNCQEARRMRLSPRNHARTLHPSLPFAVDALAEPASCRDERAISVARRGQRKRRPWRGDQSRRRVLRVRLGQSDCRLSWLTLPLTNPTAVPTVKGVPLFPQGRRPQTPGPGEHCRPRALRAFDSQLVLGLVGPDAAATRTPGRIQSVVSAADSSVIALL